MPTKTDFGDLTLYASSGEDAEQTFLKFRTDIAGVTPDSNFNKIANILASHDFSIENTRKIFDVNANKISENYYESSDFEVNKYYPHMLIILSVSETNTGNVTVNINSLGNIPVKKFDTLGNLVQLSPNDLIKNIKYLIEFNGDSFILLNQITAFQRKRTEKHTDSFLKTSSLIVNKDSYCSTARDNISAQWS